MWHFVLLVVCAVAIYLSCEWFVNAVEWLGLRLKVGRMAVGTILAAVGTALPESVVTLVAVTTGNGSTGKNIGIGAALGGPLALSTVAYAVTGIALLVRRRATARRPVPVGVPGGGPPAAPREAAEPPEPTGVLASGAESARLARDQRWFLAVFVVKVALGLVAFSIKPWLGWLFFATYGVYFWREVRREDSGARDALDPLRLQPRRADPAWWAVAVQTAGTLAVIFFASELFVSQLDAVGPLLGLPAAVTALLLSPVATELPEVMNAIIWVRQGKTSLALANISGAMMIQATVPSGIGLLFTPWKFDAPLIWAAGVTMLAIVYLLLTMRFSTLTPRRLAWTGVLYVAFVAGLVPILN